jgi:hypothetical protein
LVQAHILFLILSSISQNFAVPQQWRKPFP